MSSLLVALLLLFPLPQNDSTAPPSDAATLAKLTPDPAAGKELWQGQTNSCKNCHGMNGDGGFGPVLAGRKLPADQFVKAVRTPRWLMPRFPEHQIGDQDLVNFAAWFDGLPMPPKPSPWRVAVPDGAPRGQVLAIKNVGCGQCHNAEFDTPRHSAGAINADFEWLKTQVYDHFPAAKQFWAALELKRPPPRVRMGTYSTMRLPEPVLKEIWDWMNDLGLLAPVTGGLSDGVQGANGVTYTVTLENLGIKGKGLSAEDVTVSLRLPAGAAVVATTGDGYQGVHHDEESKGEAAVWKLARIAPKDEVKLSLTLSKAGTKEDNLRGVAQWTNQGPKRPHDEIDLRVGSRGRTTP